MYRFVLPYGRIAEFQWFCCWCFVLFSIKISRWMIPYWEVENPNWYMFMNCESWMMRKRIKNDYRKKRINKQHFLHYSFLHPDNNNNYFHWSRTLAKHSSLLFMFERNFHNWNQCNPFSLCRTFFDFVRFYYFIWPSSHNLKLQIPRAFQFQAFIQVEKIFCMMIKN